jgi:hypothetical protein
MSHEADGWKVSRFATAAIQGSAVPNDASDSELIWARESAIDFLELLVGGSDEHLLTLNMLTEPLKQTVPAPSVADAGLKYAKQDVRNWLNKSRNSATGFAITAQGRDEGGFVFRGDLVGPEKTSAFRLLLIRDGEIWKVGAFESK